MRIVRLAALAGALALGAGATTASATVFDFGTVPATTTTPFTITAGGVTATFTSTLVPDDFAPNPSTFLTFGPTVLQSSGLQPAALDITFSAPVLDPRFGFATEDFSFLGGATPITVTFYDGATVVGTITQAGTYPATGVLPEGAIDFANSPVTEITITDPLTNGLAIGDITVPEPASLLLLLAGTGALLLSRRRLRGPVVATALLGSTFAASCADAQTSPPALTFRQAVTTQQEMVVTANPIASNVGAQILAAGGNAIDASIAVEAVLGLVEPQATGIGGGGFVVYFDAATKKVTTYDAREAAPATATGTYFTDKNGVTLGFSTAVFSGKSVGVPTVVKLWDYIRRQHGTMPVATLLAPAIQLATNGFQISPRMAASIASYASILKQDANAAAYFLNPDGTGKPAGTLLKNPAYAATLTRIAWLGPKAFYTGPVANDIVTTVQNDTRPGGPGLLSLADLNNYQIIERTPVCGPYRAYVVCGMGPPSSGGIAELQILGMLSRFDLASLGPNALLTVHYFLQANALAFADRNLYVADPGFVPQPTAGLIDPTYLAQRSQLITSGPLTQFPEPAGTPPAVGATGSPDASPPNFGGTSHVSIVDRFGNVLAQTITVESPFGNNRVVDGFILNNELTDFSFDPGPANAPIANRVQGGKRPRSSMSPTIIFTPQGKPAFVTGSPGGASIIGTTTQSILALVDFGYDPQQAANQAHFQNNNSNPTILESLFNPAIAPGQPGGAPAGTTGLIGPFDVRTLAPQLQALGWTSISSAPTVLTSGLNIIKVLPTGGLQGGSDPRREGIAAGQ
jgi:gamma-glutamyltranspeptidase/glutathione hydrolase